MQPVCSTNLTNQVSDSLGRGVSVERGYMGLAMAVPPRGRKYCEWRLGIPQEKTMYRSIDPGFCLLSDYDVLGLPPWNNSEICK